MPPLDFDADGAALHPGAALPLLPALDAIADRAPRDRAGTRLHDDPALAALLNAGPLHAIAADAIGSTARAVRAILFDKSPAVNWALGWHQDRTIVVQERHDVPGFGPWSVKAGLQHVEPPFDVIAAMVTLRVHLDDVPADNAPLLIAPGSHRLGRVSEAAIDDVATCGDSIACLARRGDVWAYATSIVHASASSGRAGRRRVVQIDYAASDLPAPLAWRGVG